MNKENQRLIEEFEELLGIEKTARDFYQKMLEDSALEPHSRSVITHIKDDEVSHMVIVQNILDIIKKGQA